MLQLLHFDLIIEEMYLSNDGQSGAIFNGYMYKVLPLQYCIYFYGSEDGMFSVRQFICSATAVDTEYKGKKGVRGNNRLEYIFRYFTDTDNPNKFLTGPDFILIHQCWSLVKMINVKAQEEEQDS